MTDDDKPRINLGYPLTQLLKALSGTEEQAPVRAKQWRQVLSGLLDGTLRVGSRTPVANTPPWVTLEVVHGGFATGNWAAAGALQPHEVQKLGSVPRPGQATDRGTLNLYFLSDLGQPELAAMLANGCFRIQVPEEGALLIAAWLMERGEAERAAGLIESIMPFFDQLRFYPIPNPRPAQASAGVYVQTVGESIKSLRAKRPQAAVARMNEAIQVWTPLYDRAVSLFLETVDGEMPALQTTSSGQLLRGPNGQPLVAGGWPCRHYPADWASRAHQLLMAYGHARAQHTLCAKPEKAKENFARLRTYLAMCSDDPSAVTGRDVGMIRKILASYVTRHGAPGSDRLRETRATQAVAAARPMHHVLARVLADRLQEYPEDEGAPELRNLRADRREGTERSMDLPLRQPVANGMPHGSVLLCSTTNRRQRRMIEQVSTHLKC